jgi:hypothetical protein
MVVAAALLFVVSFVVCAAVRRWAVIAVVVVLPPAYFAGLLLGAWGDDVGDGWQYAAVAATAAVAMGAIGGFPVGRRIVRARSSPKLRRSTGC